MKQGDLKRLLIFTGDGKGKTTAALGMAMRALGHGLSVKIIQFVKSDPDTGEIALMRRLPDLEIVQTGRGFVPPQSHPAFADHAAAARTALALSREALASGQYQLVVLDEICTAIHLALISEQNVLELLSHAAQCLIVILTGRGATPGLIALADTVTEMKCIKHGYESGIKAQKGVEI